MLVPQTTLKVDDLEELLGLRQKKYSIHGYGLLQQKRTD